MRSNDRHERVGLLDEHHVSINPSSSNKQANNQSITQSRFALYFLLLLALLTVMFLSYLMNDLFERWPGIGGYHSLKSDGHGNLLIDQSNTHSTKYLRGHSFDPSTIPSPFSLELNEYWKPLPEIRARSVCGNWQSNYQSNHSRVSSGRYFLEEFIATGVIPPPPVIVFRIDATRTTGGISDRWPILSTMMVIATTIDRFIYFDWPGYDAAYNHPNLPWIHNTTVQHVYSHWQFYVTRIDELNAIREHNLKINQSNDQSINRTLREYPTSPHLSKEDAMNVVMDPKLILHSKTHDFALLFDGGARPDTRVDGITSMDHLRSLYGPDRPIVYFSAALGGKGLTKLFYDNPVTNVELERLKIKQQLCHGCMINFVLGLNERVQEMFDPFARRLLARDTLTLGLQFRMGDWAMKGSSGADEKVKHDLAWQSDPVQLSRFLSTWFQCVNQLVEMHRDSYDQPVLLFIVSDDVRLRKFLTTQYQPPFSFKNYEIMMIPTEGDGAFAIGHTDVGDRSIFDPTKSQLKATDVDRYLQVAAGEQWLLAYCDFFAIDQQASGFGRSAVLRSLKLKNAFDGRHVKSCQQENAHLTLENWYQIGHKY